MTRIAPYVQSGRADAIEAPLPADPDAAAAASQSVVLPGSPVPADALRTELNCIAHLFSRRPTSLCSTRRSNCQHDSRIPAMSGRLETSTATSATTHRRFGP
jgi:hypothetical protein